MLPKKNRLNLSLKTIRGGRRFALEAFDVIYRESDRKRGAVIITKAVAKKAVDRNRAKRLIMETLKSSDTKGEFIFIVKQNLKDFKKKDIDEIFGSVIRKINT